MQLAPLTITETPRLTAARAGVLTRNAGADVLFIDYLGLMTGDGKTEYERVTAISGDLKRLARTLGIVVIALCQMNRETEQNRDSRPRLSQLRSSGALEQDADAVLLLHRPGAEQGAQAEPFEVDVAKNRHGQTGIAKFDFFAATNRFADGRGAKSW